MTLRASRRNPWFTSFKLELLEQPGPEAYHYGIKIRRPNMKNVFQSRNYRLVFFGALVSELGALLYSFAVSFYILEISSNNAFLQGLYLALCGGMNLIATPLGGVLGDRFNKARIMSLCDYIKGGVIISATLLMLAFPQANAHIAILFVTGITGSAIGGIFSPASASLLPRIVDESLLQQATSYYTVRSSAQSILGVVLAGVLYAALPITSLFIIVGVCYVLSGVSEMFIRYGHVPSEERLTLRTALGDMKDGLKYVTANKALFALMSAILFINFFITPVVGNFIPYFIKTDVGGAPHYLFDRVLTPELWLSVLEVCIGVSSVIAAAIMSARKQTEKCGRTVSIMLALIAVLLFGLAAAYSVFVKSGASLNAFLITLTAGSFITGALVTLINIPINVAIMRTVDKGMLSKVSSITSVASQGLTPIASVLAGAILQGAGSAALLFFCAAGFAAAAAYLLLNKRVKEI